MCKNVLFYLMKLTDSWLWPRIYHRDAFVKAQNSQINTAVLTRMLICAC